MNTGPFSTIQDLGRYGFQDLGIPVSGALDANSLRVANALVGNAETNAAIEFRLTGPALRIDADEVLIGLAGTEDSLLIEGSDPRHIKGWHSGVVRRGEIVYAPVLKDTSTAYIAISGGIDTVPVLESRSTYVRGGIGGHEGRALQAGDELPIGRFQGTMKPNMFSDPPRGVPDRLRVVAGPQDDMFTQDALDRLISNSFSVTSESDRMGMRLEGPELPHIDSYDIVSDGIATGAIQVPGNKQPILLLADHQTTGGYPKIATVISADIPGAGRLRTGDMIGFAVVTVEEAEAIARETMKRLHGLIGTNTPAIDPGKIDVDALYNANLISGITNMHK
ncbi:MAG: biotin-dependent carboxyltransferase family protein [Alphaproteobacteria bacterium]|nr:biotin-dependent carboxyltransferase family protein [Alphaproteobacteria bacterium]